MPRLLILLLTAAALLSSFSHGAPNQLRSRQLVEGEAVTSDAASAQADAPNEEAQKLTEQKETEDQKQAQKEPPQSPEEAPEEEPKEDSGINSEEAMKDEPNSPNKASEQKTAENSNANPSVLTKKAAETPAVKVAETLPLDQNDPPITTPKNATIHVNATALSLGACEKIDLSIGYLTELDFETSFANYSFVTSNSQKKDASSAYTDVYILQLIITPISIALLFFGSFLILPTCILAATAIGVFAVFHVLDNLWLSRYSAEIDCPMKLALSCISAFMAAMMATAFVRFGLFSLGAMAMGVVSYLLFDAFPFLDIGATAELESDLSTFAWIVTILMGLLGGLLLRWYEEASLELVTATLGGISCSYSIHTIVIVQGGGQLDRSVVFLMAVVLAGIGCRSQRRRRLRRYAMYHELKREDEEEQPLTGKPISPKESNAVTAAIIPMEMLQAQQLMQSPQMHQGPTWQQVQYSIDHAVRGMERNNGPTSEQIENLTQSLNLLLERVGHKVEGDVEGKGD